MQSPVADRKYEDPKPVHVIRHSGDRELKKESPDDTAAVASGGIDGTGGSDAGAIELARRPRGRPRGSRNKPKPPIIIEAESPSAMRAHILEIPAGHDIADCLARFSRRKNLGLCVLAGTGAVANVTLRQPGEAGATFSYLGRFEILSITATLMPPQLAAAAAPGLCITLAGPQGRVVGGAVVGPLLAAGKVVMVAAAFVEPSFHRLPVEEDVSVTVSGEQAREVEHEYDDPLLRHQQQLGAAGTPESCAMSVYSCQLPSEAIWAPTAARPPAPSPY